MDVHLRRRGLPTGPNTEPDGGGGVRPPIQKQSLFVGAKGFPQESRRLDRTGPISGAHEKARLVASSIPAKLRHLREPFLARPAALARQRATDIPGPRGLGERVLLMAGPTGLSPCPIGPAGVRVDPGLAYGELTPG